jgi:hypothetical protein
LAAFGIGGFGLQLLIAFAVLSAALSVGLAAVASVRMAGIVFLGRPRTPRTAVAEEIPRMLRRCLVGLTALTGLLAVFPGLALLPASPALARLANGSGLGMVLMLKPGAAAPGYSPVAIAGLLALVCYAMLWLSHRRGPAHRREPVWSGGFAPPPPWLPFGDPTTQIGSASFAEPLRRILDHWDPWPAWPGAVRLRHASSLVRLRVGLRRAAGASGRPGLAGSVAATLAVLILALAVWLAAL